MKNAESVMKYAESVFKKAEQNSSYCSFLPSETFPLLLYYYIIIYRGYTFFQKKTGKNKKICLCVRRKGRLHQQSNNDGECLKSTTKDDDGFLIFEVCIFDMGFCLFMS